MNARWTVALPRWVVALVAVACIGAGTALVMRPFSSIEVLVFLAAAAALITGALALSAPTTEHPVKRRFVGLGWVAVGLLMLLWPGMSVGALAVVIGVGLVAHGLADLFEVATGRVRTERATVALGALATLVFGLLALAWPDVTVLVVAVLFGARTVMFGVSQLIALRSGRPGPAPTTESEGSGGVARWLRLTGRVVGLAVALALLAVSVTLHDTGRSISTFYDSPEIVPERSGQLLRTERYATGIPDGAQAWLIMYTTEDSLGEPTVATAVVVASLDLPPDPRPAIAWSHGTVGVARPCAPSLSAAPFADLPAVTALLDHGWVLIATDYAGMGTEGVSPYLIGSGEAYSTLDSIRAAQQVPGLSLSGHTVVWGHSQGGHAALWAGILAHTYAPELSLDGVAALSPATDVSTMASVVQGHLGGSLGSAYVIRAYSETYADVDFAAYVRPGATVQVREAAARCLSDPGLVVSFITSLPASQSVFAVDPTTGALGTRLTENIPDDAIQAPLLVAQGTDDEVIPVEITDEWVAERCAAGQPLEYVTYPGRNHMGVLHVDSPLNEKLVSWTIARFAGEAATPTC